MRTEDLLIVLFCTVDDWLQVHPPPRRPGPAPACSDSEVLTFALARELLGYTSERRFRRVLRADWPHLFPIVPAQSELNRRTRWLWGAFEQLRRHWLARLPSATEAWYAIDTTPLPVKQPSRVRGPDQWRGQGDLTAGFGRCAAKGLWFYGFRIAVLAPLGDPVPVRWALIPAAGDERQAALDLVEGLAALHLLTDKGFRGRPFAAALAEQAITLLTPPTKAERTTLPPALRQFIAAHRNRIEAGFNTLTDQLHLEHHRAHTLWGLLTRLASKFAAVTLRAVWRRAGLDVE